MKNKTIFQIIATFLGIKALTMVDGHPDLSDEQKTKIKKVYGQEFLDKLLASSDADADARSIFEQMVNEARESAATIETLQNTVAQLSAAPEPKPAPSPAAPAAPAAGSVAARVNESFLHNRLAAQALASANPGAVLSGVSASNSIDVSELNAELGTVMPAGVKLEVLAKRIYNGFEDAQYMTRVQSNTDYKASAALMEEVSQQFTAAWTPKGRSKFTPIVIKYRRHKINVEILPAEILKSWLLYLWEQGKTNAEMPITKYLIEEHILPKVTDDITLSMIGKGKYVEVTGAKDGDTGSAAADSMDGYETILVEARQDANSKINFFKRAADFRQMTSAQLLAYVDSFVDAISPLFARHLELHCSPEFLTRYKRADFEINGKYTGDENNGKIRFSSFTLIPLQSMYNSPILFATPRENFVMLVDLSNAENCINKIEEQNYKVKVFGEYSLSTGFKIAEAVYAAVPAGYNPKGSIANDATSISDAWVQGSGEGSASSDGSSSSSEAAPGETQGETI